MLRMVLVEADSAEETEALGRAVERVMNAAGRPGARLEMLPLGSPPDELKALPEQAASIPEVEIGEEAPGPAAPPEASAKPKPTTIECTVCGKPIGVTGMGTHMAAHRRRGETEAPDGAPAAQAMNRKPKPTAGDFACPEPGCDRSFPTASGLGRHRSCAHSTPGSSSAAKYRARAKGAAATEAQAMAAPRTPFRPRTTIPETPAARRQREQYGVSRLNHPPVDSSTVGGAGGEDDED